MKKKAMRCYRALALGARDLLEEVLFKLPDHGYDLRLYSCLACGERFVSDAGYEHYSGIRLDTDSRSIVCPFCHSPLKETLRPYPQEFRACEESVSHFECPQHYPSDTDTVVTDLWDLDSD